MNKKILIADDDDDVLSALKLLLKSESFNPVAVSSPDEVIRALRREEFDLALLDLNYSLDTTSGEEGLELISAIRRCDDLTPIVVMTGWGTIELAVNTLKKGANDFIQKPWDNDRLLAIIASQIKLAAAQKKSQKLSEQNLLLRQEHHLDDFVIAESEVMKPVLNTLKQVATSDACILFTGENGTGKSMFARYLHNLSHRWEAPLVSVNMGSVTETLFESEMFGHVRGAFTDADTTRIGRVELADGGTLFLDEIANTPYTQQGKLLRVLEERKLEKVGSGRTQMVDFRLVTATNADLNFAVTNGKFRKDLLYRINTVEIEIPPLRRRGQDIIPLAKAFLTKLRKKYSSPALIIGTAAQKALLSYPWPGNVRELSHVMERAQILCKSDTLRPSDLGLGSSDLTCSNPADDLRYLDEIEEDVIKKRLRYFSGDAARAADSLGLSRSAFYRRLEKSKN